MASWHFVGRNAELNQLRAAAAGQTGRGLVVGGVAGVGKSRLLREGTTSLDGERYAIWTASAHAATGGLPFGSFAHALPTDQPAGLSPAGLLRWAVDALHHQAAGRPIVFAVDDIQFLDPLSAALIYGIARSEHATVLATLRNGEPVLDPVTALWKDDLVDRVELAPFSDAEIAELLGHVLGGPVDATTTERLHRLSQGNALLLRELVLAAAAGGDFAETYGLWRWTGRLELAPSLVEVIDARIGQLSDRVRTVVELVALGEPLGLPLLSAATDTGAVEVAEERQLIRIERDDRRTMVRLAHPLYGEVVRRRCPVTRTRRLLARLAELVEGTGQRRRDDALRVAVWRLESHTADDPAQLLHAGRLAFAAFDIPLAARLVSASLDAGGGFDAAELLATILMFADQPAQALAVLDGVREDATTDGRLSRWYTARSLVRYYGLSLEDARDELNAAAEALADPGDRAWIMSFESITRLHHMECAESLRLARAVLDRPAASASARAVARSAIAHLLALRGAGAQAARTVAAIEADGGQWRSETPHIQIALELARGTGLILAAGFAGVDAIAATEFADLSDAGNFRLGSGYLSVILGQAARLRGRLGAAMRFQRKACSELATSRIFAGLANAERAHVAALSGNAAEAVLAMAEADRVHEPTVAILYPWLEHARCWVLAGSGELDGAVRLARALAERTHADAFHAHEAIALHDLVRLGRPEEAVQRLHRLAAEVDTPLVPVMAAHARAAADRDAAGLLLVAERFAALGTNLLAAEAAAGAFNRMHQTRSTRIVEAARLYATLLEACEGARTPALTVHRPTLSLREHQIARLAASGVTSKDIADQLYLSARTVDNHLRRVYAKLGVAGRGELQPALRAMTKDP